MADHIYRIRSVDAALDGFSELERQQIYFSPFDDLNDPMEGYKDVFWRGDHVLWRNLLRHYILCLQETVARCLSLGADFKGSDLRDTVFLTFNALPMAPVRDIYQRACATFFADASIRSLIEVLANRSSPLRRDELRHILRAIHPFALLALITELKPYGVDGLFRDMDALKVQATRMNETVARAAAMTPQDQSVAERLFAASELIVEQMVLAQDYNNPPTPDSQGALFLLRDCVGAFVQALDQLIHPPCFVACFVSDPTNPSMWATYGAGHTGVCLQFKTIPDASGRPSLDLNGVRGWRGGSGTAPEPVYSFSPHTFHKMNYSPAYPEIDFFNSIGQMPIPALNATWYTSETGERSTCIAARALDTDAWREAYWASFQSGATIKTAEWEHEQEQRLLLWSSLSDLRELSFRKLTYRFSDLAGLIFGAKTKADDKRRMMKIIEKKCRTEKRSDFVFHEMQYSRMERRFKVVPLPLIKFNGL